MKDPGDEGRHDRHDRQDAPDAPDAPDDQTLLDELFGDATDADPDFDYDAHDDVAADYGTGADVADEVLGGPPAPPVPAAESVALAEPGLPEPGLAEPGGVRRLPVWQGLMWARTGVRPATAPGCREVGLTTTGFVIFVIVDSIMMYAPFRTHSSTNLLPQAVTLALLAFGLGPLLIWSIRGACRPVGVGMMLGWVFMTLISAGYFTGLNP
jgi:hypothetical protein